MVFAALRYSASKPSISKSSSTSSRPEAPDYPRIAGQYCPMCKIHPTVPLHPEPPPPAAPLTARIPARSRGQAMDWSLVLASQGIEHAIDDPAETGWGLIVAESDRAAALEAIRLYRR